MTIDRPAQESLTGFLADWAFLVPGVCLGHWGWLLAPRVGVWPGTEVLGGTWLLITPVMQFRSQRRAVCLRERLQRPGTSLGGPATWRDRFALSFSQEKLSAALRSSGPGHIADPGPVGPLAALAGGSGLRPVCAGEGWEGRDVFKEAGGGAFHSGSVGPGSGPGTAPSRPFHPCSRAGRALHLDTLVQTGACYFLPRRSELQPL